MRIGQNHSIGDLYPWTIRYRDNGKRILIEPFHCLTGEVGPLFAYECGGQTSGFKIAYRQAEKWIRNQSDATKKLEARLDRLCGKD